MTVIVVSSVHGSPGTTSLAFDLTSAFVDRAILIEADPDGGSLAARFDLALKPGLMELAGAARAGLEPADLWNYAQSATGGVAVVVAHPAAEQTSSALRAAGAQIASAAARFEGLVVIDIGRLRPGSPALSALSPSAHTLIVTENSVEAVVSLANRTQLIGGCPSPMVILNGAAPYGSADIAAVTQQRVWGVVPRAHSRRDGRARATAIENLFVTLQLAKSPLAFVDDLVASS